MRKTSLPAPLRRRSWSGTLSVLLLGSLPLMASAQSLLELYEAARAFDGTYLAARAAAQSAEYRAAQADALARPSAQVSASATANRVDPPRLSADTSAIIGATLSGRYPLYNRSNALSIEQARKSLEVSKAELEAAEQDLVVRVAQAYFDVLAAQDSLTTTRGNLTAITEQLASAKRNFEVGTATITDTREVQARFDLSKAAELAAENDLLSRRIALDTLVGRTGVEPKRLLIPLELPPVQPERPEEWVSLADQLHPAVRRARVALELAQLETGKARAAEAPTVDAVAQVGASNLSQSRFSPNGLSNNASVGVQLNWPLYTGGATQNRIKETLSLEEKSRNELEAARRNIGQTSRVAYFGVLSGMAQVRALEAAESSAKLALESTQLGYRVGVRVNLDVLNAQRDLFNTQRDLARARYEVLLGGLRLKQASGQLGLNDVQTLNRLLAP